MKTSLKFGLTQAAAPSPVWLVNTAAVVTLLVSVQTQLIDGMPGLSPMAKQAIAGWFSYTMEIIQVALAIAVIFTGKTYKDDQQ